MHFNLLHERKENILILLLFLQQNTYIFVIVNVRFGSLDLILVMGILPTVLCIFQSINLIYYFTPSFNQQRNSFQTAVCLYRWDFQGEAKVKALSFFFSLSLKKRKRLNVIPA